MKVLHILDELKPSGAETMLETAAPYWKEEGLDLDILATGKRIGGYKPELEAAGYTIHHLPFARNLRFATQVFQFLWKHEYDVVHIHPQRVNFIYCLAAALTRVPRIVRTVHHIFPYDGLLAKRIKLERQIATRILGIEFISNSHSGKKNELKRYGIDNDIVYNWYDDELFQPPTSEQRKEARRAFDFSDEELVLVSLGGFWEYKNYDYVVRAIAELPEAAEVLYVHIGKKGEKLQQEAEKHGVADKVRPMGFVDDVLPILYASDVYVMPSSIEGFGIAAVEAMATGLPVILSDVPALRDFRRFTDDIYWVAPRITDLVEAIRHFRVLSEKKRKAIGERLHQAMKDRFTPRKGAQSYLEIYREQ
jgi:glycosyltransferase involved in cell wall biosynthesis